MHSSLSHFFDARASFSRFFSTKERFVSPASTIPKYNSSGSRGTLWLTYYDVQHTCIFKMVGRSALGCPEGSHGSSKSTLLSYPHCTAPLIVCTFVTVAQNDWAISTRVSWRTTGFLKKHFVELPPLYYPTYTVWSVHIRCLVALTAKNVFRTSFPYQDLCHSESHF